jgi:hypothetical protein
VYEVLLALDEQPIPFSEVIRQVLDPERGAYSRQHFRDVKRFGNVIVCAGLEPFYAVVDRVASGNEKYHDAAGPRIFFEQPAHLETVHLGDHDIQEDEIRELLSRQLERCLAIHGGEDLISLQLEDALCAVEKLLVVFNQEDTRLPGRAAWARCGGALL